MAGKQGAQKPLATSTRERDVAPRSWPPVRPPHKHRLGAGGPPASSRGTGRGPGAMHARRRAPAPSAHLTRLAPGQVTSAPTKCSRTQPAQGGWHPAAHTPSHQHARHNADERRAGGPAAVQRPPATRRAALRFRIQARTASGGGGRVRGFAAPARSTARRAPQPRPPGWPRLAPVQGCPSAPVPDAVALAQPLQRAPVAGASRRAVAPGI